ncbi:hypothetical protein GCM10010251_22200 [Streptomyces aurantiogriseus]|uniref:Uncharacterized protein n=1 Tax=Streptomyces aurantiogriseus TaxID=66870 RepID=A0A918C5J2_9ACTN|nr:hypothetical protein GCM10010251_22200 [Streptomyces aurantiogriseus]
MSPPAARNQWSSSGFPSPTGLTRAGRAEAASSSAHSEGIRRRIAADTRTVKVTVDDTTGPLGFAAAAVPRRRWAAAPGWAGRAEVDGPRVKQEDRTKGECDDQCPP